MPDRPFLMPPVPDDVKRLEALREAERLLSIRNGKALDPDHLLRLAQWLVTGENLTELVAAQVLPAEVVDVPPDEDCEECGHPGIRHSNSGCMVITGAPTPLGEAYCACLQRGDHAAWQRDVADSVELLPTTPGQVAWRIELTPHSWGVDGQAYEHGVGTPSEAAAALLRTSKEIAGWRETIADADVLARRAAGEDTFIIDRSQLGEEQPDREPTPADEEAWDDREEAQRTPALAGDVQDDDTPQPMPAEEYEQHLQELQRGVDLSTAAADDDGPQPPLDDSFSLAMPCARCSHSRGDHGAGRPHRCRNRQRVGFGEPSIACDCPSFTMPAALPTNTETEETDRG